MSNVNLGTPGQPLNINGGVNSGDTIIINAGKYPSGNIQNLPTGVTIDASAAEINGTIALSKIDGCILKNGLSNNIIKDANNSGDGFQWNGSFKNVQQVGWKFQNVAGNPNNASQKVFYAGTDASLKFDNILFSGCKSISSNLFLQGSFGGASSLESFMRNVRVSGLYVRGAKGSGTQVTGIYFDAEFDNWDYDNTGAPLNGDVGLIQMNGNANVHHIKRVGGPGYILRIWQCGLNKVADTYFWNNLDVNTSDYGTVDVRIDKTQFSQYVQGANFHAYNNTSGNKGNTINYWASQFVVGDYPAPYVAEFHNNFGFNLNTTNTAGVKPKIIMNQGQGWTSTPATDSNNYYSDSSNGVIDPNTFQPLPGSPLINKGQVIGMVTDDLYHVLRGNTNDLGCVQSVPVKPNQPPVANAGQPQTITAPANSVSLDGSASSDPDGSIASYGWSQISGSVATIANPNSSKTNVSGLAVGSSIFRLTVTDDKGATATSDVSVTVNPAPKVAKKVTTSVFDQNNILIQSSDINL